jgi:Spy/CpxP family protein refolding chaperone
MALKDRSATFLLVVALIAGVTIGFAGSTLAYRYKLLRVPGGNMVERMSRSLSLSPSQREAIVEVMEDTRAEVMQLRRSMQRQRRRLMIGAYLKVRAILNPEQQKNSTTNSSRQNFATKRAKPSSGAETMRRKHLLRQL